MKPQTGSHHFSGQLNYDLQGSTAIVTPKKVDTEHKSVQPRILKYASQIIWTLIQ
jgi:hypothetical protein